MKAKKQTQANPQNKSNKTSVRGLSLYLRRVDEVARKAERVRGFTI